jgi:hypothetical protein
VILVADHPRPEALLEEMALPAVPAIEALRVEAEDAMHHPAQLTRRRHLHDHVEVRAEHGVRQKLDPEHLRCAMQQHHERVAVHVVDEDEHAARPPRPDVKPARRQEASRDPRHGSDGRGAPAAAPAFVTLSLQGLSPGPGR